MKRTHFFFAGIVLIFVAFFILLISLLVLQATSNYTESTLVLLFVVYVVLMIIGWGCLQLSKGRRIGRIPLSTSTEFPFSENLVGSYILHVETQQFIH